MGQCMVVLWLIVPIGCDNCQTDGGREINLVLATVANMQVRPILLAAIEEFEDENPHVEVELMEIPGSKYYQKLLVMMAGGNAPDLMWMGVGFADFVSRGVFFDLSSRIESEIDTREYHPTVLGWYRSGDKQYGVPYGISLDLVVYNKKLFDKAGISYPEDNWRVEDLLVKAKALTIDRDGDGQIDQYGYRGEIPHPMFGAKIITSDGSRALCNSSEMVEAIQFNMELVFKWKVSAWLPWMWDETHPAGEQYSLFRQGRAAMMRSSTHEIMYLQERCADVEWDITVCPQARKRAYWASSKAYLVSASTRHPDKAWLLFKNLISDHYQMALATVPANLRLARKMVEQNTQKPANLQVLLEATNHLYHMPSHHELVDIFFRNVRKISTFYGTAQQISPKEGMIEAERQINEAIVRNRS